MAGSSRTRPPEALKAIMANGSVVAAYQTTIAGYGTGNVGVWYQSPAL